VHPIDESVKTVLIADDHDGFRAALQTLLAGTDDLSVVGAAADRAARRLSPRRGG
jgi:DNA-binding NarL/FixJ family response regulator